MHSFQFILSLYPTLEKLTGQDHSTEPISLRGLVGSALAILLATSKHRPLLCLMDDADSAGYLYSDIEQLLGQGQVLLFPSSYRRAIRYGHQDDANILLRSMVLSAIVQSQSQQTPLPIIVTYPEAIAERVSSKESISSEYLTLRSGEIISQEQLRDQLLKWGFNRVDYVYEPGQFAIRGSIFDIYSFTHELPYRLDFFDDEIDSIRIFEIESQLSVESLNEITLMPNLVPSQTEEYSLLDLLPQETYLLCSNDSYWQDIVQTIYDTEPMQYDEEGFGSLTELRQHLVSPAHLQEVASKLRRLYYRNAQGEDIRKLSFSQEPQPIFHKQFDLLVETLTQWNKQGYKVYISSASVDQYARISDIIRERSQVLLPEHLPLTLHEGFVDNGRKIAILTEHQLFGRYHKYNLRSEKARSGKLTLSLKELSTFDLGDFVVHSEHGIGLFGGLMTMDIGGKPQEVIKITYKNNDTIYVNVHSLHKLSHYRNKENNEAIQLSTLGSGAWQRLKEKTKKRVKDIARELIKLYAQRREVEGYSYSPDTYLQHELEASFKYEDTPDQRKTTDQVKADMERPYPMDRLVCGDVGFGKTEVAIRAAFKAATDGKQVAVLVPTTVLAYQHYRTFSQRLQNFPVRVEYISRARTTSEIKSIVKDLSEGKIDIIIGTHRLTSKDIHFKDLGLLIIDEEQKFGVAVKERLRRLQVNVDTLTMSATPIPRTLQFSLMGARDLSNINTPPPNRYPVETVLARFNAETIREAINFELSRNGQVYFVHNRIQNIEEVAAVIKREVPDARIVIGHGQMSPAQIEQILLDFTNHEYDVLIATTIIENGIDVSNANTIIINEANHYGLSELHQLRGRVGRSNRKAFCYLLSPPIATLPEDARRRLKAIESFSDLGSGVRIALQDLDIRGAGNMLGAEQSGFIADMGYETYQKVFEEAVGELKATEFADLYTSPEQTNTADRFVVETQVDTDLELLLPESYVPSNAERILLYRELDNLTADEDLVSFREKLIDRFGNPPQATEELILIPRLRRLARNIGLEKLILKSDLMSMHLISDPQSPYYQSPVFGQLMSYVAMHNKRCQISQRKDKYIIRVKEVSSVASAIEICQQILNQGGLDS